MGMLLNNLPKDVLIDGVIVPLIEEGQWAPLARGSKSLQKDVNEGFMRIAAGMVGDAPQGPLRSPEARHEALRYLGRRLPPPPPLLSDWELWESQTGSEQARQAGNVVRAVRAKGQDVLALPELRLCSVPPQMFDLTKLRCVDLRYNQLHRLPEDLGRLLHLEQLYLTGNLLETLPDAINKLMHLTRLEASDNSLRSLPLFSAQLTRLSVLKLAHNPLGDLNALVQLPSIEELDVSYTRLDHLPAHMGCWASLFYLNIQGKALRQLPSNFAQLLQLKRFDGAYNDFCAIPRPLTKLKTLTSVDLRHNFIEHVSGSIGKLINLERLDLSSNKIVHLPRELEYCARLEFIALNDNDFATLPPIIFRMQRRVSIELLGMPHLARLMDGLSRHRRAQLHIG